jgi:hypothetical protein
LRAAAQAVGVPSYTTEYMSKGPLALLIERGYRPGQRLSDWVASRTGAPPAPRPVE